MANKILVLNTGSTSTKLAVYFGDKKEIQQEYSHSEETLRQFTRVVEQLPIRREIAYTFVDTIASACAPFDAVVALGGFLGPIRPGGYEINKAMVEYALNSTEEHASNLAPSIAYDFKQKYNIPRAFVYDSISSDELEPIARITGIPDLPKVALCHMLNMRATALKIAKVIGKDYNKATFIIAHIGGGISLSIHHNGKVVDTIADDEGPFAPERAGGHQAVQLLKYMEKVPSLLGKIKVMRGNSGLRGYFGTSDVREVEKLIAAGDEKAKLVFEAMAYKISKAIAGLSVVSYGKVDCIILTGGVANSKAMADLIAKRTMHIAPLRVCPGENEMESLAMGANRILNGEETAQEFPHDIATPINS